MEPATHREALRLSVNSVPARQNGGALGLVKRLRLVPVFFQWLGAECRAIIMFSGPTKPLVD